MPFLHIFPVLGAITMVFALTMLVPTGVSAWTHDGAGFAYPEAMFVTSLTDMPFDTAFTAIVASVNNMGPGLNELGPTGNYAGLTDFQTWVCTLAMILGRLEMLSFLVLFTPGFWRK